MAISAAITAIIPVLFFVAVAQLTKARGPQWLSYTFENPYHYLLNSVLMVTGQPSPYVMHPGTTTLTFGAIGLRVSSLKSTDDLVAYTLRNPEKQIKSLHQALLIFTALLLWMPPWLTTVALRSYIAGFLIQAPCLFFQSFLIWESVFGPELMIVGFSTAVVCCCVLLLIPSTFSEKRIVFGLTDRSATFGSIGLLRITIVAPICTLIAAFGLVAWNAVFGPELMNVGLCAVALCAFLVLPWIIPGKRLLCGLAETATPLESVRFLRIPIVASITGLLCAFGLATKLIFFPLILISLFCCRTRRNLASFAATFVLGLAFALAPIYSQLPYVVSSTLSLAIHSGVYGSGSVGLPQSNVYLQSLSDLFGVDPCL